MFTREPPKRTYNLQDESPGSQDPYPNLPSGPFNISMKMIDDGERFVIFLPREFQGLSFGISGNAGFRSLHIQQGVGILAKKSAVQEGKMPTCELTFPIESVESREGEFKRYATSSGDKSRRIGAKITLGPLVDFMAIDYTPAGRHTPLVVSTAVQKPSVVIRPELDAIKDSITTINKAVKEKGLQLSLRDDGTLKATFDMG